MNVILLILDALRYDHVNHEITPNLMKLAEDGVFFTHAMACNSSTNLSMPCILCSHKKYNPDENIATVFNQKGYKTALIHSNPIVEVFYHGWKEKIDIKTHKMRLKKSWKKTIRKNLPAPVIAGLKKVRANVVDEAAYLPYARADETIEFTINWINENERYLVWSHIMDPHIPYYPRESSLDITGKKMIELNDKFVEAAHGNYLPTDDEIEIMKTLYREDIGEMDKELVTLQRELDSDDLLIVTTDHGEEFAEFGQFSHQGNKIIPELIHVPLIIYGGGVKEGLVVDKWVSSLNIAPTILEAVGIDEKLGYGKSLWSLIT